MKVLAFDPAIETRPATPVVAAVNNGEITPEQLAAPPFKTNLVLDEEKKAKLLLEIKTRIDECRTEMGWTNVSRSGRPTEFNENSWLWKRNNHQQQYDNEFDWREAKYGGIFEESNWSMNMCKRFIRVMAAKMADDLVGTEPFFAVMPQRPGPGETLAKQIEEYCQTEIGRSNLKETLKEGQRVALIRNDAVVKVTYVRNATKFIGPAKVMCGPWYDKFQKKPFAANEPLMTRGGDYIYENDDVIPDPAVQNQFRLRKDPSFVMPPVGQLPFIEFDDLEQTLLEYEGVDAAVLDYRDFIFPIRCRTLNEGDLKVHVYDETYDRLKTVYTGFGIFDEYMSTYESEAKKARVEQGETEASSRVLKLVTVFEGVFRTDADGDGYEEQVYFAYDYKRNALIFYDYLGNHMKVAPYVMIPGAEKVEGRAYGTGIYELLAHKQLYVDMMFNRVNFKSSKDGSATFKVAGAIKEENNGIPFIIGSKHIYEAAPGYDAKNPPVFRVNLAEIDEKGFELMEKMVQAGQLEVGIVSAADGSSSDLNASGTATGVRNIERTGNVLQNDTEQLHAKCFSEIINMAIETVLENMKPTEVFYSRDGTSLATLNRSEIRALPKDIRLLLTKARSSESLEVNAQADAIVDKYYQRPKWLQKRIRQFAVNQLKALDVADADTVLVEPTDQEIQAEAEQASKQQQKPLTQSESISIKLGELAPTERVQALAKVGIKAGSPEEIQAFITSQQKSSAKPAGPKPAAKSGPSQGA